MLLRPLSSTSIMAQTRFHLGWLACLPDSWMGRRKATLVAGQVAALLLGCSLFLSSCGGGSSANGGNGGSGGSGGGGGSTTQFTLTVKLGGSGSGTVTSTPSGINCGATCSASFDSGTSVTLQATAATGSTFSAWSGACSGTSTCAMTISQDSSVTASFGISAAGGGQQNFTVDLGAQGLAIDKSGNIWIASNGMGNDGQNVVTKMSSAGAILETYGLGTAVDPCCVAIDSQGNIWAAGTPGSANGQDAVAVLAPNGTISTYYTFPETTNGITNYAPANAVTIDKAGNEWFVAGTALQGATIVDTVQEMINGTVSTFDIGIGGMSCTLSMVIDAEGNKFFGSPCGAGQASTQSTDTVYVLTASGGVVSFPVGENYDAGSAVGIGMDKSGNIWVTNPADDTITKLTWQGGFNSTQTPTSATYPTIHTPMEVAIDSAGNVWVGGTGGITELSSSGTLVKTYTDNPLDSGVEGLVIDASGNVWASTVASASGASSGVVELTGAATGPQYFPYSGPQWP
jgi:streptogramin lyase